MKEPELSPNSLTFGQLGNRLTLPLFPQGRVEKVQAGEEAGGLLASMEGAGLGMGATYLLKGQGIQVIGQDSRLQQF